MTDTDLIALLDKLVHDLGNGACACGLEYIEAAVEAEDRIKTLIAERDEAVNQLDSARHSVGILEQRGMALIFELSTVIKACSDLSQQHIAEWNRAEAAEAKLAECEARLRKAVKALNNAAIQLDWCQTAREISKEIDATLAEIKSGVATTPYGLEGV